MKTADYGDADNTCIVFQLIAMYEEVDYDQLLKISIEGRGKAELVSTGSEIQESSALTVRYG